MRWHLWSSLFASVAIATTAPAIAAPQPTSISSLTRPTTQLASEQGPTTISGRVAQIVGNEFGLSDLTGQIVVQVGSDWKQMPNLKVGEQVTVTGRLSSDRKFQATSIQQPNGAVINVPPSNNTQSLQPQ